MQHPQGTRGLVLALALVLGWIVAGPAGTARAQGGGEQPAPREDPERAIARLVREMQLDLEGSSSSGLLGKIDSAKFDDFPRFQDMVERLVREDTLRVYFRQVTNSVVDDVAQTMLDAEMEMTRKDSTAPAEQRRQQITIDLERTARGWKITKITPRDFFRPL